MSYISLHNHLNEESNIKMKDSTNKYDEFLDKALELGLKGVAITGHESLKSHVKVHRYIQENKERFKDFQLILGNEIYLLDRNEYMKKTAANESLKFFHFILLAKDEIGYKQLKWLSDRAWRNYQVYHGVERTPTFKETLKAVVQKNPGHLIASTACLGGELPFHLLKIRDNEEVEYHKAKCMEFINFMKELFQDDFYFELQPSENPKQIYVNDMLRKLGQALNVKCICTTDSHYLTKAEKQTHKIFLRSRMDMDREEEDFYATTYLMGEEEIKTYFPDFEELKANTLEIGKKIKSEEYNFKHSYIMPPAKMPKEFKGADKILDLISAPTSTHFEYIRKFYQSPYQIDRWLLKCIETGLFQYENNITKECLERIELELSEIWKISDSLGERVSQYFVITKDIIDLMWTVSLVGVARGSSSCYYINYLLGIVQISALEFDLPYWRFMSSDRPTMPDIDIDTEAAQRRRLVELVKEEYGEENVLNISTNTTEAVKSTIVDVCLGYGLTRDVGTLLANVYPKDNKDEWDMRDAFFGNEDKGRKPSQAFINAIYELMEVEDEEQFKEIRKCMLDINGLYSGRSQHASGLIIYPNGYLEHNLQMRTKDGLIVSQYDAEDSEYCGGTKLDFLTVSGLDRIRACLDLLLKHNVIEWQGSLRETYNKYLHPKNIDLTQPLLYDTIFSGEVFDLFQFSTLLGASTIKKLNARTFDELCSANSLMRLTVKEGEQPLDKFIRHRDNPQSWDKEMDDYGLTEDEKNVLKNYLSYCYGICSTQEDIMRLIHDPKIGNYTMTQANGYRKLIAKKNQKKFEQEKQIYLERGMSNGNRELFLNYVWEVMFDPCKGYAFSHPHIKPYTLIGVQEAFLCMKYGFMFWKTACLLVNSGMLGGEDTKKSVDYGFIASAITPMKDSVLPPSINKSDYVFEPDIESGKIFYGFKTIVGLGKDTANKILQSPRPFKNFEHYFSSFGKTLSDKKNILLIKAGCFDEFNSSRRDLMIEYLKLKYPVKAITLTQLPIVLGELQSIPGFEFEVNLYNFKKVIQGKGKYEKEIKDSWIKWFMSTDLKQKIPYRFTETGDIELCPKTFKKVYDNLIQPLQQELKQEKYWEIVANCRRRKVWIEECLGTPEKWEMQSLNLYFGRHELDLVNLDQFFTISDFTTLKEEPEFIIRTNRYNKQFKEPVCYDIAGTVVDKNKDKSTITLLTQTGIVYVKIPRGKFAHYDETLNINGVEEKSWFNKGNILVVTGFRSDEQFMNRKPKNKATSIVRVHIHPQTGELGLQKNRIGEEN